MDMFYAACEIRDRPDLGNIAQNQIDEEEAAELAVLKAEEELLEIQKEQEAMDEE
jgi:hypothetical protein